MNYDLRADCPFRKKNGIRLTRARVMEVAACAENPGGGFPCHKTVKFTDDEESYDQESYDQEKAKHCAGALVFADKQGASSQMMRICERLGVYDPSKLRGHDIVFDSIEEDMLDTAVDIRRTPRKRKKRTRPSTASKRMP